MTDMATSSKTECTVCQKVSAEIWCPECSKAFCSRCSKRHKRSNSSINHETITIDNFQNLPSFVKEIKLYCIDHKDMYRAYCLNHEKPLCQKCMVTTHKNCKDTTNLRSIIQKASNAYSFENLGQNLNDVIHHLRVIIQNRMENMQQLKQQASDIRKEISEIRSKVNLSFDQLQGTLLKELDDAVETNTHTIYSLNEEIRKKEKKFQTIKNGFEDFKTNATSFHTFLTTKYIEESLHEEQESLQCLLDHGDIDEINISLRIDNGLKDLINRVTKYGEITLSTSPTKLSIFDKNIRQTQVPVRNFDSTLSLSQTFDVKKRHSDPIQIAGICMLPNTDLVFIESNGRFIIHSLNGKFKEDFSIQRITNSYRIDDEMNDITAMNDKTVTVATDHSNILIVDTQRKAVTKVKLKPLDSCFGIDYDGNSLFFTSYVGGLKKLDPVDLKFSPFYNPGLDPHSSVAVSGKNVYLSNTYYNSVTLLDDSANVKWIFHDLTSLPSPRKLTIDNNGNVYVIDGNTNNIVFISHDGKQSRQILVAEDRLDIPAGIFYDKRKRQLIVVNLFGKVFVYNSV